MATNEDLNINVKSSVDVKALTTLETALKHVTDSMFNLTKMGKGSSDSFKNLSTRADELRGKIDALKSAQNKAGDVMTGVTSKTDKLTGGMTRTKGASDKLGGGLNVLSGVASGLTSVIGDQDTAFSKAINTMSNFGFTAYGLVNTLGPVIATIGALGTALAGVEKFAGLSFSAGDFTGGLIKKGMQLDLESQMKEFMSKLPPGMSFAEKTIKEQQERLALKTKNIRENPFGFFAHNLPSKEDWLKHKDDKPGLRTGIGNRVVKQIEEIVTEQDKFIKALQNMNEALGFSKAQRLDARTSGTGEVRNLTSGLVQPSMFGDDGKAKEALETSDKTLVNAVAVFDKMQSVFALLDVGSHTFVADVMKAFGYVNAIVSGLGLFKSITSILTGGISGASGAVNLPSINNPSYATNQTPIYITANIDGLTFLKTNIPKYNNYKGAIRVF